MCHLKMMAMTSRKKFKICRAYPLAGKHGKFFVTMGPYICRRVFAMEYYQIIAQRITSLRNKRGISVNELARMSGIKQSTLDNIIHGGSKNPQMKTIHKISYAFGLTISEFLDFPEMNEVSFEDDTSED